MSNNSQYSNHKNQYVQILHILPKIAKHTIPTIMNFLIVQTEEINGIK